MKPRAIDLFCGLGGWTDGLLAAGYNVTGFDIEAHQYGGERYPARLVLEDVRAIDGARFADVDLIVASPPCTEYSYMAMPFGRGKQIARALRGEDEFPNGYSGSRTVGELTALFDACFRIQAQASAAAGRHVPLVVENVRGAQPWVGQAKWNFGSYYLWGDVPALMPSAVGARKVNSDRMVPVVGASGSWFAVDKKGRHVARVPVDGRKHHGDRFSDPDSPSRQGGMTREGRKGAGAGAKWFDQNLCSLPSKSPRRKEASARIAKVPLTLSSWVARAYLPPPRRE